MQRGSMGIFLRGLVVAWVLGPAPAVAATLYVPSPQHPTLVSAVSAATEGDSIEVDATWTPAEPAVFLDVGVTVRGAGGLANLPALVVGGGARVILEDVSFVGIEGGPAVVAGPGTSVDLVDAVFDGNALGGLIVDGASATLDGCTFRDNGDPPHWDQGVDIWVSEGAVTVGDSTFSSDAASAVELGAVFLKGASASFVGTAFEGYRGDRGAVFHAIPGDSGGVLVLDQVTVVGAHASEGGGVAWLDHVETTVVGSVFTGLSSDGDAAGFYVWGGSIEVVGVRTSDLRALGDGGFVRATDGAEVRADDVGFAGTTNWAAARSGGAFSLEDSSLEWANGWSRDLWVSEEGAVVALKGSSVLLDAVVATGNTAMRGGVLWADGSSWVEILRSRFEGNLGLVDAGVLGLHGSADGKITGNHFCANESGLGGAALSVAGFATGRLEVQNNVFQDNTGGAGGTMLAIGTDLTPGDGLSVVNNTFLGNGGSAVAVADTPLALWNNILMGSTVGLARVGGSTLEGGHNLWNGNGLDAVGASLPGTGAVLADPAFHHYLPGDCDAVLWLAPGSPARDAGTPTLTDPDGSRSDIGAFGGPLSDLPDDDADAWYADLDCADDLAGVHPGATEVPYDGIDQDCDGADLCDVDLDGFDAWACDGPDCDDAASEVNPDATEAWYDGVDQDCDGNDDDRDGDGFAAGEAGGSDCDDDDADVHPGAEERYDDPIDQDCDGNAPRSFFTGGCGCAPGGTPKGGVGGLLVLVLLAACRSWGRRSPQSRLARRSG